MGSARTYLAAFAELHALDDADERRRVARQGIAVLAQLAEREPAPLEGIAADALLKSVRAALDDGVLGDLEWLSPAAAAIALFELAQALPAGGERRELGRRVLTRRRDADRDTFGRLLIALARSSPKVVASEGLRARLEVVLSAPLTAPGAIGELALGLLAQPSLAQSWSEIPATGSLPARRLAARILAHGAREAVRRLESGDRGSAQVLVRPGVRAALGRLLGDREALVWRFASIARGMLAHVDSELADDIDRELRMTATNTQLRRAAASAASALERGGAATRWASLLVERALRARESKPETGGVAHGGLRIARLRALVRLLDGVRATADADLGPRLAAVRQLMERAQYDQSSLRRAVWAALTRAGDALRRDGHAELTDFLLAWTTAFPDEDFAIVREASMVPEIEKAFEAYARLQQATWAAADPADTDAIRTVVERLAEHPAARHCRACSSASTSRGRSGAAPAAPCCSPCAPKNAHARTASSSHSRFPTTPAMPRATSPSRSSSGCSARKPAHCSPCPRRRTSPASSRSMRARSPSRSSSWSSSAARTSSARSKPPI